MHHKILVYGGLGNVGSERIIPALNYLAGKFSIEYATVDLDDKGPGNYFNFGTEPLHNYSAAIIATPNNTHAPLAIKALNSGLNILCEKPLSNTMDSAKQILLAAQSHPGLTAMLCDHYVYKPAIRNLLNNWQRYQEELGQITNIEAKVFEQGLQKGREWLFFKDISGGGIAMDTGIHIVSILGKIFGYANLTVRGAKMTKYPQSPGDTETYASIALSAGKIPVHIEVAKWMDNVQKQMVIKGTKSILEVDIEGGRITMDGKTKKTASKDDCYPVLIEEFLSAIEQRRLPRTTLEEGYEALQIVVTAYQMAEWA